MNSRLIALAAAAVVCLGADWTEFRGPTGQGLAGDAALPIQWGPEKNVAWKQAIPGKGWSSPVVADGKIYLTTAAPSEGGHDGDLSLRALCLDGDSGKILWSKEVFLEQKGKAPGIHSKNSHASPTALVHGDRLFVHFGHMGTACLDLDGKVIWKNTDLKYQPVHGNGGTPILVGDSLIFSCDGQDQRFLAALSVKDGSLLWKTKRSVDAVKGFSFHTPLLIAVEGKEQVVSAGSGMVAGYDPQSGDEIWKVRYNGYSVIPRPVYGAGLVFVATGYDSPKLLAIRPEGKGDVTDTHVAWIMNKNAPHTPSPLLVGDELYTVSDGGVATCVDAKTGEEHWHERLGGNFSASPVAAGGSIYFQSEEGVGTVVKAGKKFDRVAKNDLKERTLASYAAIGDDWLIRTEENLYRIKGK
jgi:outer membrane protein assembly factor BamB